MYATVLILGGAAFGQQQAPTIRTTSQEVLLDVVVRDKGQRAVANLGPDDIEVLEDGVRQTIRSFRYYDGRRPEGTPGGPTPAAGATTAANGAIDPMRQINLVTLVFESMDTTARLRALEITRDFLKNELRSNTFVAVFTLNHRLAMVQPYTNRVDLLQSAAEKVAQGQYLKIAEQSAEWVRLNQVPTSSSPRDVSDAGKDRYRPLNPGSAEDRGPAEDGLVAGIRKQALALELRMLLHQQGFLSIEALRTIIREQSGLPGRKTVMYFCQGLVVPPAMPELLRTVISEANRANITFYGVDASGLTGASPGYAATALAEAVADDGGAVPHVAFQQNLFELSEGTGGFGMANSNDLRSPLRHVMEEVNAHYELSYAPTSTNYDGRFRKIEVRLKRPGLKAQYRKGYYALPMLKGKTLAPFEIAAMSALDANPAPRAFDVRVAAFAMRSGPDGVDNRVVFEVPAEALRFEDAPKSKTFRVHLSALALIKDAHGNVLEKLSSDVPFSAPLEKKDAFRNGTVSVTLPATLAPGNYLLEAAAIDRVASSASVRRVRITVAVARSPWLSDLVVARRVDPPRADRDPLDPLEPSFGVITPAARTTFSRRAVGSVRMFALLQPGADEPVEVTLQVVEDGKVVASARPELGQPDGLGAIPISATVDASRWAVGAHEIVLVAKQGATTVSKVASVIVE